MAQRIDWSPRDRCKILRDKYYSYEEIIREIGENFTKSGICKHLKRNEETQSLQNKTGKGRKIFTSRDDG